MVKVIVETPDIESGRKIMRLLKYHKSQDILYKDHISDIRIDNNKIDSNIDKDYFELEN